MSAKIIEFKDYKESMQEGEWKELYSKFYLVGTYLGKYGPTTVNVQVLKMAPGKV